MNGGTTEAGRLGVRLFLASLSVLFAASIVGYLAVRLRAEQWPPPGMPPLPAGLWVSTLVILLCSGTIHGAVTAVRRDCAPHTRLWLVLTLALGSLFLVLQGWNWWQMVAARMPVGTRNLYAFTFYTLTGLHAVHVVGGLVFLGAVTHQSFRRVPSRAHVQYCASYWHFLDVVWLILFVVLVVGG